MGIERQGPKGGGGYVGGFLHLFDWNAKSRKKLFSSKSDLPEQSKQKRRSHENLPMTKFHQMDEDENAAGSSIRGSSDYSCASSVTDEEVCGRKAPGVVARLMGLDTLPTSNISESYSTQSFDCQSLQDAFYRRKDLEFQQDPQIMHSGYLHNKVEASVRNAVEPKPLKMVRRPIEKFQTETLPPKSAKSIPVTHHKLLSPIKGPCFVPSKNVAHIMEAAAKIIEPGHQATNKAKMPHLGSSSVPLKVRDLKEKVEAAKRPSKLDEASRRPVESNAAKYLKGQSMNKSWNGSADTKSSRGSSDLEEYSAGLRNKGKSISLALQAKVNVQKREGLNLNGSRSFFGPKEKSEVITSQEFQSQPNTQRSTNKKPSTHNASTVLRPNNQKQNCLVDRGKLPSKSLASNSMGRKVLSGDSSSGRKISSRTSAKPKAASRKSGLEATDSKKEVSCSSTKNVTSKKRSLDGDFQYEKNRVLDNVEKNGKSAQSNELTDRRFNWAEDNKRNGMDVISFTFTAPMARSMASRETSREVVEKNNGFSAEYRGKRMLQNSDGTNGSKLSSLGYNVIGGDALSTLLEQKLRELTYGVEFSRQKAGTAGSSASIFQDMVPSLKGVTTTPILHDKRNQDETHTDKIASQSGLSFSTTGPQGLIEKNKPQGSEETDECSSNINEIRKLLDCRHPSPISVLDPSYLTESCNSSDTTDSNSSESSRLCSSVQAQEVLGISSSKKLHLMDADTELSDSASSTSTTTMARKQVQSTKWELEYVKEILCDVELMLKDFAFGGSHEIINPHLFDLLEAHQRVQGDEPKQRRKVLFDCVCECVDSRCKRYVGGGYRAWAKGLSLVRRKEWLAEEVYKEISGWKGMGDCMVDEIVDKDMSSQYGKWLDFEVEAFGVGIEIEDRILNYLINEVVADILLV